MDEAVLTGNITRVVENLCHDELATLNRGVGYLLGQPDLPTDGNPLGPATIVGAFSKAVDSLKTDRKIKFQIMKDLNQAQLGDIAAIYAYLNQHLTRLNMMPARNKASIVNRGSSADRRRRPRPQRRRPARRRRRRRRRPKLDVMAMFKRMYGSMTPQPGAVAARHAAAMPQMPPAGRCRRRCDGDLPVISMPNGHADADVVAAFAPMRPTPSGYVPGAPIISSPDLHEGLTRLQAGQTDFDVGGAQVDVLRHSAGPAQRPARPAGIPARAEGEPARVDDHRDGRDAVRLHLRDQGPSRRHQGAARAPADSRAQGGDARRRVLRQEDASVAPARQPARAGGARLGARDGPRGSALSSKIDEIVHQILDNFSDDLTIFDEQREALETFLAEEEKAAEENIQSSAEEINQKDRQQIASVIAKAEIEKRIEASPGTEFPRAVPSRQVAGRARARVPRPRARKARRGSRGVATLEDLVWSVQPKRSPEDRRHLVALLPSLLKRLSAGMQQPRLGRPTSAKHSCPISSRRTPRR